MLHPVGMFLSSIDNENTSVASPTFCSSIAKLQLEPGLHLGVISGTMMSGNLSGNTFTTVSTPCSTSGYKFEDMFTVTGKFP